MKNLFALTILVVSSALFVPRAQAQCPAGLADPVYLLNNTSWAFQTFDSSLVTGDSTVGIFNAVVQPPSLQNPYYTGILNITMTSNQAGTVNRWQPVTGKYQINSDCKSGALQINQNGNVYQYGFVFAAASTQMYLVTASSQGNNQGFGNFQGQVGIARLTPQGCPKGNVNPLAILDQTTYAYQSFDSVRASIGTFKTTLTAPTPDKPYPTGVLSVTETTTSLGADSSLAGYPGSVQVNPDCSGGQLSFNVQGGSFQYDFVFAGDRTEMYFVDANGNLNTTNLNAILAFIGVGHHGTAKRY